MGAPQARVLAGIGDRRAHWPLYERPAGWLVASAVRSLLPAVSIVLLFHGYTAVVGTNLFPLDYGTFLVSVVVAEVAGHALIDRSFSTEVNVGAAGLVVLPAIGFGVWTFHPPDIFLFEQPQ